MKPKHRYEAHNKGYKILPLHTMFSGRKHRQRQSKFTAKSQRSGPTLTATKDREVGLFPAIKRWLGAKGGCYCGREVMVYLACKFKVAFMAPRLEPVITVEENEPNLVRQGGSEPLR